MDGGGAAGTQEPLTEGSAFEGLFQRTLRPTGAFAEELKAAGYDVKAHQPRYPTRVWRDCLEVARRHVCADLPQALGFRELGRRFVEGFFATATGRVIAVGMTMMSPERSIQRLGRYWAMMRTGVEFRLTEEARGCWRVTVQDPYPQPDYMAAIMESALRRSGPGVQVDVVSTRPDGFDVRIRW